MKDGTVLCGSVRVYKKGNRYAKMCIGYYFLTMNHTRDGLRMLFAAGLSGRRCKCISKFSLFLFTENEASKENDVHDDEEGHEDDEGQIGLYRC